MFEKIDDTSKDGVVAEIPVLKERKMLGWERLKPGCTLFEINLADLSDVKPVVYKKTTIDKGIVHNQVIIKPGFFYAMAINKKNALRKFWKTNPRFKPAS